MLPLLALQAVLLSLLHCTQPVHAVLDQAEHLALFKQVSVAVKVPSFFSRYISNKLIKS